MEDHELSPRSPRCHRSLRKRNTRIPLLPILAYMRPLLEEHCISCSDPLLEFSHTMQQVEKLPTVIYLNPKPATLNPKPHLSPRRKHSEQNRMNPAFGFLCEALSKLPYSMGCIGVIWGLWKRKWKLESRVLSLEFRVQTPSIPLNNPYSSPLYNPLCNPL